MAAILCSACGRLRGSNASCVVCRDAAAKELAHDARDITDDDVGARGEQARSFVERPPWYARFAPQQLLARLDLVGMLLRDVAAGRYRRLPWRSVAALAAAAAYVVSPLDLIPDFLVPIGWTDDMLVMMLAWQMVKRELREYCEWKGLAPARYDL